MPLAALLSPLHFETPQYLILFLLLPLIVVFSFRSLSGLGPIRRWLAIALRCAVITCMILALAGAERVLRSDESSIIFVVDRSSSVPRVKQQEAFDFVKKAAESLRPTKDRLGVIAFDGKSSVEQLPMAALGVDRIAGPIRPDMTNIAGALSMAMALFPSDASRRVVLLTDGNENAGQALEEVKHYAAADVPIDVLPLRYDIQDEVIFERLSAPATANLDETVNLQMVLRSTKQISGKIILRHNDEIEDLDPSGPGYALKWTLEPGANRIPIPISLRSQGAHRFQATFEPDDAKVDTIAGNNEGRAFTVVGGPGKVLILTSPSTPDSPGNVESAMLLSEALRREKLVSDVQVCGERVVDPVLLLEYSLVILSNVPASLVSENERAAMASYVRDLGGGLIMVGGDDSFGPGGWMDTPIEEVLPVSFDVKSKQQIPKGALVLLMHACEIPAGNYWGERVAVAAVKTLSSRDLVGVLSYQWQGANQQYWDVPLQEVRDKTRIIQGIQKMAMGDLPDFEPLAAAAADALTARKDAAAKHMIVISDFDPAGPSDETLAKLKRAGVTVSTVAIGYGSHWIDTGKAKRIADITGGKFYTTDDYTQLPQIFIKESRVVRRSLINETPFTPLIGNRLSTLIEGLPGDAIPQLGGYVVTTAKPSATIPLVRKTEDGNDPILAHWQVGLGKTVAFTSGMWNRWGSDWSNWEKFSKLWAQIARWASRPSAASKFDVTTSVQGGRGRIRVDALDASAAALNFMNIDGTLLQPDLTATPLQLTQTGPGRYEAEFDARDAGSYVLNLAYQMGRGADAVAGSLQTGLSVAYSPEYRELSANETLLDEMARQTSGRKLDKASAASVFDPAFLKPAEKRRSIWEPLIQIMLVLFLLDVAVRRIAINPLEIARRIRSRIAEMGRFGKPVEESAAVLNTLKGKRAEVRDEVARPGERGSEAGPAPTRGAKYDPSTSQAGSTEKLSDVLGGASELDAPIVAKPTTKKPTSAGEADYASRLLKAKKSAREKLSDDDKPAGS